MDRRQALTLFAAAAAAAVLMGWENENVVHWWSPLLAFPWALLVSGVLALGLLGPFLRQAREPALRTAYHALVGVTFGMVTHEAVLSVHFLTDGRVTPTDATRLLMHAAVVAAAAFVLTRAWVARTPGEETTLGAAAVAGLAVFAVDALAPVAVAALVAAHVVACVGLTGYRPARGAVARAAGAAAAVFAIGLVGLFAAYHTSLVPPRLALSGHLFRALVLPLAGLAGFAAVAVLVFQHRTRPALNP